MPWGTKYVAHYKNLSTGEVQDSPPPGTCCMAEKLKRAGHTGVGPANAFFSHAWKFKFADVVQAMQIFVARQRAAGNRDPVYFWFDIMVVDEHASQAYPPEWWETAFARAVANIGHTCLMMTPWDAPVVMSRAWCLWEVYCTLEAEQHCGCNFTLALSRNEEDSLLSEVAHHGADAVLEPFAALDCRKAEATSPDDLAKIQAAIRDGPGHDRLNAAVLDRLRLWVLETVRRRLEDGAGATWELSSLQLRVRFVELLIGQGQHDEAFAACVKGFKAGGLDIVLNEEGNPTGEFLPVANHEARTTPQVDKVEELVLELKYWLLQCSEFEQEDAMALLRDVIEKQCQLQFRLTGRSGESHESVLKTRGLLATYMDHDDEEKGPFYDQLLQDLEMHLGTDNKERLMVLNNQAFYLMNLGDFEQARGVLEAAIEGQTRTLGANHPDTLASRINYCYVLKELEDYKAAKAAHELVVAACEVQHGRCHMNSLSARWNLALLLKEELGMLDEGLAQAKMCVEYSTSNPGGNPEITTRSKEYSSVVKAWEYTRAKLQAGELNLDSSWAKHIDRCGGIDGPTRAYYYDKSSKRFSLDQPAEGYFDEVVAEDLAKFESIFNNAKRTDALFKSGRLSLSSPWTKAENGDRCYYFREGSDGSFVATTITPAEGIRGVEVESDEEFEECFQLARNQPAPEDTSSSEADTSEEEQHHDPDGT